MNSPSSPARRSYFSWSLRPVSSTPSLPPSFSPWSPSPRARTSFRYGHHHRDTSRYILTWLKTCLNAPEPADSNGVDGESAVDSPEEQHSAPAPMPPNMPPQAMPRNQPAAPYMTADQQHALQYQAYLQQQQAAQQGAYPMPPQQQMHSRG